MYFQLLSVQVIEFQHTYTESNKKSEISLIFQTSCSCKEKLSLLQLKEIGEFD